MLLKNLQGKKFLIPGIIVLFVLLTLSLFLAQKNKQRQGLPIVEVEDRQQEAVNPLPLPELQTVNVPAMTFTSYQTPSTNVTVPNKVKAYTFISDYSLPFISMVGQKLGLKESKEEAGTVLLYNNDASDDNVGFLKFNTTTGTYEYSSYGTKVLPQKGASLTENVRSFLVELGLADETVNCAITYQKANLPDLTFIECHRDWVSAGLPILNFVGLLNIPDLKALSDIKVGMVEENTPENPDIINVSTGQNGKERPDDFNTTTVAVDSGGNIVRITSNLKIVESAIDFAASELFTPDEAINRFRYGNTLLTLIVPVDDKASWETVFPGNTAYDLNAQVNDVLLAYIENPFGGKSLTPMYLARGTALTTDGYDVKFLQAIPALKNQQSLSGVVAGLMAQQPIPTQYYDETLKLGTWNPEQRTLTPDSGSNCVPAENQLSPIISLGEFGMVGQFTIGAEGLKRKNNWFLIPAGQTLPEISSVIAQFDQLSLTGNSAEIRELNKLNQEWTNYNFCPLRLSGSSPTLFGYGKSADSYQVKVGRSIVYLNTNSDNTLYYEYQPVSFNKPDKGWNINKSDLVVFAQKIGDQLQLTVAEKDKLAFELNLAAAKVASEKLFVGIIPQTEVDTKIPLTVSPQVPVLRYHFYVDKQGSPTVVPDVKPLVRTSQMVLEVGAVSY